MRRPVRLGRRPAKAKAAQEKAADADAGANHVNAEEKATEDKGVAVVGARIAMTKAPAVGGTPVVPTKAVAVNAVAVVKAAAGLQSNPGTWNRFRGRSGIAGSLMVPLSRIVPCV